MSDARTDVLTDDVEVRPDPEWRPDGDAETTDRTAVRAGDGPSGDGHDRERDRVTVTRRTRRWDVGLVAGLVAAGTGVLLGNLAVFLTAVVGFVYAGYGAVSGTPTGRVTVSRTVDDTSPLPDERVRITVEARNASSRTIPDLRLVDGVPEGLTVVAGSPRLGATLGPDETATASYVLRARRGEYEFDPATVVARNVAGSATSRRPVVEETTITCRTAVPDSPLRAKTTPLVGRVETDAGGDGIEFHGTREYRRGDPVGRIDWNRFARTHDLSTVQFREARAGTVVVLVDDREVSRVRHRPDAPDGVRLSTYAAGRLAGSAIAGTDTVGVAAFDSDRYVDPRAGEEARVRIDRVLAAIADGAADEADDADDTGPPVPDAQSDGWRPRSSSVDPSRLYARTIGPGSYDGDRGGHPGPWVGPAVAPDVEATTDDGDDTDAATTATVDELVDRLPPSAQILFVTPAVDDRPIDAAERLAAYGHPVTLVSPDVTDDRTAGGLLSRVERTRRLADCRGRDVRVVDWSPDEPLSSAVERAETRWSR